MTLFFETPRLKLRSWIPTDFEPFYHMNSNPEVMRYFPSLMTRQKSDQLAQTIQEEIDLKGFGFWAVELKSTHEFIGFVGLHEVSYEAFFTPAIEIGWRIDSRHWRKGYAYEAAAATLKYAKEKLHFKQVVSFTAEINLPSQALMQKLGMKQVGFFNHPKVEDGNRLKKHVLYEYKMS